MAGDLERGADELEKFSRRVSAIVGELQTDVTAALKTDTNEVTRTSLGVGIPFAEADGFFAEYARIQTALVGLSKSLEGQVEMLRIGVHAASVGYDNVEEDLRLQFYSIKSRLNKERDTALEEQKQKQSGAPAQPDAQVQHTDDSPTDLG
ncbi:hypothetical protein ACIQRS_00105 [Streptomyces termitum]|uniref:Uncharacterized protein n=1 Tax=Streptomyces termitum TaxID=67368 RepID=A0A918T6Y9_9ACTN|nr:hypothetical protein [Streptomyces termitum]GHA99292.1 hypothetical protein GCM10010305_48270 [Streptomyces termitum]